MSEVYTPFEQRIVDGYLKATYPDEPAAPDLQEAATMMTLPEDAKNIPLSTFGKMAMDVPAGLAKGAVQGTIGLPGDLISLARGVAAAASPNAGEGRLDAFLRGTKGATILPTTEDVKKFLDETLGVPLVPAGETDQIRRESAGVTETVGELFGGGKTALGLGKATAQAGAAIGRELAPKAGEMAEDLLRRQGLLLPAVPLNRYGQVTAASAAKADQGSVRLSNKVEPGKNLQLDPQYRVKVVGSYTPEGKGQNITNAVNPGNYQDIATRLDDLATSFPDPLKSNESFATMLANVYNSTEVPIPPRWMIENVNDMPKWSSWFGSMTKGQIDEAARGFAVVDKFRNAYQSGAAGADTTGTLMFWAMLSRRASAYPHESGFLDLAEAMQPVIQKAVRGEYTPADIESGLQMIKQTIPAGSPGNMVTSNANDFLRVFLPKMSEKLPDGRTKLQALHDLIANPDMTGPQIRRQFYGLAEDVGIKNKVLSFALLVSGRDDVMVLDRIQINRLFAGGDKIYDDVAHLFDGGPGLAMYEGLERSLAPRIKDLYASVGRPEQASIGRYHWESWVLSSGQEVAHPTLETIVKKAEGAAQPFANVPVKEGRMHERAFGITYERMPSGGNRFVYQTATGDKVAVTKKDLDEMFDHVMDPKNGVIPDNFPGVKFFSKDTLPDGKPNPYFGKPWYTWPGVNRELIDDFAAAIGTPLPAAGSAGAVSRTVQGGAADGSKRSGRQAGAGRQSSVTRGGRAPQSGAQ
jgi:hypothetical protein